jgi:cell division transport system ATP-binding protein
VIRFENVGLRYGNGPEVLRDLNFELPVGSFHFLTGPTGAGKSSLLKLLYLSERPTRGRVTMLGQSVSALSRADLVALRRRIGVVFQDFRLLDHLTAFDNVALPLRLAGHDEAHVQRNVSELLGWVGLRDKMELRPPVLSGGQKQLIAVARAVVNNPQIIIADEPTGNIDRDMSLKIMRLFIELNRQGATVLVATHDWPLIDTMKRPMLELFEGKLAEASWWLKPDAEQEPESP